ncbi:MAG: hypothetical protein NC122_01660 [Faecalibacterium sp.]|nr:hypothetical protein [Ruminococcus sp.]MCM1391332.1 hypothetical protein [Ruminococcus sp.]MCM1484891.1 hypothetical protein [Faecalibacterium sp.]
MKKFVSLIIAALLVISVASFAACGNKETEKVSDRVSEAFTTTEPLTSDEASDEATDESETADDESMTGNVADNSNGIVESSSDESTSDETTTKK